MIKTYRVTYISRPLATGTTWKYGKHLPHVNEDVQALSETDALTAFANVMIRLNLEASGYTSEIVAVTEMKGE